MLFDDTNLKLVYIALTKILKSLMFFLLYKNISNGMFLVKGVSSFDKRMISRKGFQDFVRQNWKGKRGEQCRTMDRIRRCRGIMNWKNYSDLNSRDKFTRLKATLQVEVSKRYPSNELMSRLKQELAEALREEDSFWRQKCREEWLKAGDRNTKYFHNCIKGRRVQNRILMLLDDMGREHFSEGGKGNLVVEFYRVLFTSSNPHDLESLFEGFRVRVTE